MDLGFIGILEGLKEDGRGLSPSADFTSRVMAEVSLLPSPVALRLRGTTVVGRISGLFSRFAIFSRARGFSFAFAAAAITAFVVFSPRPRMNTVNFEVKLPSAGSVYLTGDFNGWALPGIELVREDGRWSKKLKLPPGRYRYVFIVDGKMLPDPSAGEFVPDGFGAQNAVVDTENRIRM